MGVCLALNRHLQFAMNSGDRQMAEKKKNDDGKIRVHVYVICWNEAVILPHFLKHYAFAEKIVVLDNGSDDGSQALVEASANGEVRSYSTGGVLSDERYIEIKNSVWKESRGKADFVIVCDADEFLYHPDLSAVLGAMKERKASVLWPAGYEMVGDRIPAPEEDLLKLTPEGMRLHTYDKGLLFDPDLVDEINYDMGCHLCKPQGKIEYYRCPGLVLLHYKHLSPEYVWGRYEIYRKRMTEKDIAAGNAPHYQITRERFDHRYEMMRGKKTKIIALADEQAGDGKWRQQAEDMRVLYERAMDAFTKQDFERAYERIEEFANWQVGRYFVHAALAVIFSRKKIRSEYDAKVQQAFISVEQGYSVQRALVLAEADGSRLEALLVVARFFNQLGYFDLGLPCLESAHELAPERVDILFKVAFATYKSGDLDKAMEHCAQVIKEHPQEAGAYELSGILLRESGQTEAAEKFFASAKRLRAPAG